MIKSMQTFISKQSGLSNVESHYKIAAQHMDCNILYFNFGLFGLVIKIDNFLWVTIEMHFM